MCSNLIGCQNWWSHGHPKQLGQINRGIVVSCGYQYFTGIKREKSIVAIIHFYLVRSIFLLFCHHQDTESDFQEIDIGVAGPIFAHKKIPKAWLNNYNHTI